MAGLEKLLGASIRRLRATRGLTQAQLAEASQRSLDLISRVERGDAAPSLDTIEALSRALDVSPAELFGGSALVPTAWEERIRPLLVELTALSPAELEWVRRLLDVARERPR